MLSELESGWVHPKFYIQKEYSGWALNGLSQLRTREARKEPVKMLSFKSRKPNRLSLTLIPVFAHETTTWKRLLRTAE